jgi:hypothetical protein
MARTSNAVPCSALVLMILAVVLLLPRGGITDDTPLEPVDRTQADEHALWLGHKVLAITEAIRHPESPVAMESVLALGRDSRYYVMVRGWLSMQLETDMSILQASQGDVSPEVAARIAFLQQAIRAIDLE